MNYQHKQPDPNAIGQAILNAYSSLPTKGKPQGKEWTVLAGLAISWKDTAAIDVVAIATGNRCVGKHRQEGDDGSIVVDCHAEVLVHRCFRRLLYDELLLLQSSEKKKDKQRNGRSLLIPIPLPLQDDTKSTSHNNNHSSKKQCRYRLHPSASIHLVISQTPCGDASIYQLQTTSLSSSSSLSAATFTTSTTSTFTTTSSSSAVSTRSSINLNWTGAKPINLQNDTRDRQCIGCLRTKSSRSDALIERRTSSMCCSDKIALWCHAGLEGTLLSTFVEPIWMTSVILLAGHVQEQQREFIRLSTQRAIINRFEQVRLGSKKKEEKNNETFPILLMGIIPMIYTSTLTYNRCKSSVELATLQSLQSVPLPPPSSSPSLSPSSSSSSSPSPPPPPSLSSTTVTTKESNKKTTSSSSSPPLKKRRRKKQPKLSTPSGYAVASIIGSTTHEVFISAKGVLQGTTEKSKCLASVLSKRNFYLDYLKLIGNCDGDEADDANKLEYATAKRMNSTEYAKKKKYFLNHTMLQDWKSL